MVTGGSTSPVGRITCSVKTPPVCSISQRPGVAETNVDCGRIASHSWKRNGRLSIADGRRKPYSASVVLRCWSPRDMPLTCPMVTWLSSTNSRAFSGRYSNNVGGGSPGRSEEHTSELQSLMRISYAVFCLKKKTNTDTNNTKLHDQNSTNYTRYILTNSKE